MHIIITYFTAVPRCVQYRAVRYSRRKIYNIAKITDIQLIKEYAHDVLGIVCVTALFYYSTVHCTTIHPRPRAHAARYCGVYTL